MALPCGTTGSLTPTFVSARNVSLAVKLPYAFALDGWFPISLREPLRASVTFWEATAPVKLPARQCPPAGLRHRVRDLKKQGWYFNGDSARTGVRTSLSPTYPAHAVSNPNVKL